VIGVDNQLNRWGVPVPFRAAGRSYLMINSIGGAVAVVPLADAVTVTVTRPGWVGPFGPFGRPPHAALPSTIIASTAEARAHVRRRR
jgi:hypothetical protein